jgi:DNA repair/transcription protein MET18/MMS19
LLTTAVHVLVEYLCARLDNKDEIHNYRAGIREVAESLQAIANWKRFIPGDGIPIVTAVFGLASGSTFKDQKPPTRLALFKLIDFMFRTYVKNLTREKSVNYLVEGLISMAELEKNPACLAVVFPLYEHISKEWDLSTPDFNGIWDSFIRYFPITVGSTAQDPSAPTREDLKAYLLQCITSNDAYAEYAFPRLIDMLDTKSDLSANTKVRVSVELNLHPLT